MLNKILKVGAFVCALCITVFSSLWIITASAADDNDPTTTDYSGVYITPPLDFYFSDFGSSYSGRYFPVGWRFFLYNSPTFSTGGAITTDSLYTTNSNGVYSLIQIAFQSSAIGFSYTPPLNNTAPNWYNSITLNTSHFFSDKISGRLTSYEISKYTENSIECGISFRFNFQEGYKIYNFYNSAYYITFVNTQTFPRLYIYDYTIAPDAEISRDSYYRGLEDGYDNGFTDGKSNGYASGYQVGYNEGRVAPEYSFKEFFLGFGNAFVSVWKNILSFDFLGINLAGLVGSVLVVIVIFVVLKLIGKA